MRLKCFILIPAMLAVLIPLTSLATPLPRGAREYADVLRAEWLQAGRTALSSEHLDELNDPALTRVTRELGRTLIHLADLPIRTARLNSEKKVWSSHWYPYQERDLFESPEGPGKSTLEKYDLLRTDRKRIPSKAAVVQRSSYSSSVASWEGLCDAWSIAAVLLPEPLATASYKLKSGSILRFFVGDQKALLLKSFEGVGSASLEIFGQRFDGGPARQVNGQSFGWIQPDLYPDQFHRFLEVVLFERRLPFVIDHDPSEAVWSEPVDGGNFEILPIEGRTDQVFVRAYIYPARQLTRETRDQVGKNEHVREYNYILGGTVNAEGSLEVTYGIWLSRDFVRNSDTYRDVPGLQQLVRADSRRSHPDFVYVVPTSIFAARAPTNVEIDPHFVDMIVRPAAALEKNEGAEGNQ